MTALIKSKLSIADESGYVYFIDGHVYRHVKSNASHHFSSLFENGLIARLEAKQLIPKTNIHSRNPDNSLELEHEKITPLIFPFEWSPEMLRAAALTVLEVNTICNSFGFELKDAHPFNLAYNGSKFLYLDIGSIIMRKGITSWAAYEEFLRCYYYPLLSYEKGYTNFFRRSFLCEKGIPIEEQILIHHKIALLLGIKYSKKLITNLNYIKNIDRFSEDRIHQRFHNKSLHKIVSLFQKFRFPFKGYNPDKLKRMIQKVSVRKQTTWSDYQTRNWTNYSQIETDKSIRSSYIIDLVKKTQPKTILDLAGNQGALSNILANEPFIDYVICADKDEQAIDSLFLSSDKRPNVFPATVNFMGDAWQCITMENTRRIRCELVLALALTHHLILSNGYSMDAVIDQIISLSSKYVIIEFMPLGLWSPHFPDRQPPVFDPDQYSADKFRLSLIQRGAIIEERQVEPNRIVFLFQPDFLL